MAATTVSRRQHKWRLGCCWAVTGCQVGETTMHSELLADLSSHTGSTGWVSSTTIMLSHGARREGKGSMRSASGAAGGEKGGGVDGSRGEISG